MIDPGVQYTTFLGGNAAETGEAIQANSAGNVYVAGTTQSPDFPTTTGAFRRAGAAQNNADVFVTKLNPAGTALVYSTFVGGSDMEFGHGLAIDAAGNAYVTGTTKSSNFPTTGGAFDRSLNIPPNCPRCATDNTDGFAFKLNATGSALVYSTYLGGTDIDSPRAVAVDGGGNAYVTGETLSTDFPTTAGAFARTLHGQYDVFVTKLNPTGRASPTPHSSVGRPSTTASGSRSTPRATRSPWASRVRLISPPRQELSTGRPTAGSTSP